MTKAVPDISKSLEVELKFELTRTHLRKLLNAKPFESLMTDKPKIKTLKAVYFDTPDLKLVEHGMSLRVRKESHRYVQCCKRKAPRASSDGFARHEWQWRVKNLNLDVKLLKQCQGIMALPNDIKVGELSPLFSTRIKRQTRLLVMKNGAQVRCDIDKGRIHADSGETKLCELELELERGTVQDMLELARLITSIVPARLSSRTKARRGFDLVQGTQGTWKKAQPLALPPNATAHDILCSSFIEGFKHLIANEDCVLIQNHVEGVHQMRVALRRMRALLSTFKPQLPKGCYEDLSDHLKTAGLALSPARDLDVFIGEILFGVTSPHKEDQAALEFMREKALKHRTKAYKRAKALIHSEAYAHLLSEILHWFGSTPWIVEGNNPLARPASETAQSVLSGHHTHLLTLGQEIAKMSSPHRHKLRIALKKARYAALSFAPLYENHQTSQYLRPLAALQDSLGHLNDLAMAQDIITSLRRGARGSHAKALKRASALVEGWYDQAQPDRERALRVAWDAFTKAKPFW